MADSNVNETPVEGQGHGQHRRHPMHYRFSKDELRVFKECQRESTLYRALPAAAVLGALTFAAVKYGYLKPNARFGALPKVALAAILGYGIGKVSYRKTCMKKMIELPDSNFGHFLKNRGGGGCGGWGPSREGLMMFGAGANPRDFYWGAGRLPTDETSDAEKSEA